MTPTTIATTATVDAARSTRRFYLGALTPDAPWRRDIANPSQATRRLAEILSPGAGGAASARDVRLVAGLSGSS